MKRNLTFLFLPFILLLSVSAYVPNYFTTKAGIKTLEKNMVKLSDSFYICRYETTNIEFKQFLDYLSKTDTVLYQKCLYDSLDWENYISPYSDYYYNYPGFRFFPVSAISHESAQQYCEYLTEEYNKNSYRKFNKIKFRLPTEEEWLLATGKYKDALYAGGNDSLNAKGDFQYSFRHYIHIHGFSLAGPGYVVSDNPNYKGIHHLSGNMSEMLAEKGKAMGGSFYDYASEARVIKVFSYNEPSGCIGFRYVMEVIEK